MDKVIYISGLCANYENYEWLRGCVDHFPDFQLGVEFGTWWKKLPELPERLDAAIGLFEGIPATVHSPFYEICHEDDTEGKRQRDALYQRAIGQYHALHATSMVVHTHDGVFDKTYGQQLSVRNLKEIYHQLSAEGIPMTVENVGYPKRGNVLFDQKDFLALFDQLPEEIGCLIDTGHAMLNRWNMPEVIETLGRRIRGYHFNNNDGMDDLHYSCFDKRGYYSERQMLEVIAAAAEYSPDADVILEYRAGAHITEELLYKEIRAISRVWKEHAE